MKKTAIPFLFIATAFITTASCKKYNTVPATAPVRTIRFDLYTEKDFSADTHNIVFSIFIRKRNGELFDSAFAPIKIKDIPGAAHPISVVKTVPNNDTAELSAGFRYEIENVGVAGYIDTSGAGQLFKKIDFAFQ